VNRLLTIPAAGPVTALTWALEIGEVKRFGNCKQAVSCCGLCGSENSSAGRQKRMTISKQRNSSSADGVDRSGEAGIRKETETGRAA
jgi:transposase